MIDLENGGTPYYYTVTGDENVDSEAENKIDFEDFVDSTGGKYTTKQIGNCKEYESYVDVCNQTQDNVAIENFLLLVDTSQVDMTSRTSRGNASYSLHTDISELKNSESSYYNLQLYNRVEYTEHCIISLSEKPGLECGFVKNECAADGEIVEGGSIVFTIQYTTKISQVWQEANKNYPVYLDIAVGLEKKATEDDRTTNQRVSLPVGTQIYFETQNTKGEFERCDQPYGISGEGISDVYFYGDSILEAQDTTKLKAGIEVLWTVKVVMDFSRADMSAFDNNADYYLTADLLIGADADKPGNGEIRDSIQNWVDVNIVTELGFAVQPDNLLSQGINWYQSDRTDAEMIPFKARIAFPDDYKEIDSKYYGFVYQIEEKKTRQTNLLVPEYVPYTGDEVYLYFGSELNENNKLNAITVQENNEARKYYYYSFKYNQNLLNIVEHIGEASFILEAGENLDYSNYRVTGYLIISDDEIDETAVTEAINGSDLNSDFFVYTIAKVKTDLNIDLNTALN